MPMKSPLDVYRETVAETKDPKAGLRAVRATFGMSVSEAKEVMLQAEGAAKSLSDHQARLAIDLEKALPVDVVLRNVIRHSVLFGLLGGVFAAVAGASTIIPGLGSEADSVLAIFVGIGAALIMIVGSFPLKELFGVESGSLVLLLVPFNLALWGALIGLIVGIDERKRNVTLTK
jgi:hypothetical protein